MLQRDRVLAALRHQEPDLVPMGENHIHHHFAEAILEKKILYGSGFEELEAIWDGRRDEVVLSAIDTFCELPVALGLDYIRVPVAPVRKAYSRPRFTGPYSWVDDKGTEFHFNPEAGLEPSRKYNMDMDIDELPDPDEDFKVNDSELDTIHEVIARMKKTHFIIARLPLDGTFPYKQTVGIEEYLVRMITDPDFCHRASQVYVNRSIAYINAFLDAGADAVMPTDDYADNRGLMMGLERFNEYILPGIERQAAAAHAHGGFFIKHTDGNLWQALDGIVGAGIDGWHGIQPSIGMDLKLLKEKYGKKISFFGGVDCDTLIDGTVEDVEQQTKYAIEHAAPGGGYILTSGNGLENGTKVENYRAMMRIRQEYGHYPIQV